MSWSQSSPVVNNPTTAAVHVAAPRAQSNSDQAGRRMELRPGENIWSPPKGDIAANLERSNPDLVRTQENSAKEVDVTCKFGEASSSP